MRVHIVPCGDKYARKHHAKTIEKLVPREEIILFENDEKFTSTLKDDAYACWGVTNAKNNSNYKNWQTMQKDDICIMYRDKTFFSCGKITAKFKNKEFSEYLWGSKEDGQLWENMFLIDEIKEINVPLDVLKKVMGYKEKFFIQGYTTFDNESSEKIVAAFQIPFFEKSFNDTALKVEIERREKMWMEIQKIQNIRPLTAEEVRSIGCYGSARGIWRDTKNTSDITPSGKGVCVGISSRGKYEDDFGEETGTYDYPKTEMRGQDSADIESLRSAMQLKLPIFLIRNANEKGELINSGKRRKVDKVFVLYDSPEDNSIVITFSEGGKDDYEIPIEEEDTFQERETSVKTTKSKKRSQEVFRKKLLKRIGPKHCVLCDALPEVIEAAHIRPVKDNGGDQSGNGIWLCRNHHSLFDLNKWSIDPKYLEIIPNNQNSLNSLQIMRSNIRHLKYPPSKEALEWRWKKFNKDQDMN